MTRVHFVCKAWSMSVEIMVESCESLPMDAAAQIDSLTAQMLKIAHEVCAKHTITTEDTWMGQTRTVHTAPTVDCHGGAIYISMVSNRIVDNKTSMETVRAATLAVTLAWAEAGLLPNGRYKPVRRTPRAKHLTWSTGFWHMGQWCVTGYCRGVKIPAETAAAA